MPTKPFVGGGTKFKEEIEQLNTTLQCQGLPRRVCRTRGKVGSETTMPWQLQLRARCLAKASSQPRQPAQSLCHKCDCGDNFSDKPQHDPGSANCQAGWRCSAPYRFHPGYGCDGRRRWKQGKAGWWRASQLGTRWRAGTVCNSTSHSVTVNFLRIILNAL